MNKFQVPFRYGIERDINVIKLEIVDYDTPTQTMQKCQELWGDVDCIVSMITHGVIHVIIERDKLYKRCGSCYMGGTCRIKPNESCVVR